MIAELRRGTARLPTVSAQYSVSNPLVGGPGGGLFIRIFAHKPVSGKPLETRMGKGKGEPEYWVAIVKPGTVMFEITGVDEPTAKRALARVAHKMPVPCRFVGRKHAVA